MSLSEDAQPESELAAHEPARHGLVVDAIYEDGVIKPLAPLDLETGTPVSLRIWPRVDGSGRIVPAPAPAPPRAALRSGWLRDIGASLAQPAIGARGRVALTYMDIALLIFGLIVYGLTRFIGLDRFPIYFFSDEAIQQTLAEQLIRNNFRDSAGILLPTYLMNDDKWSNSLSVYAQVLSVALFGKSVLVARATSAIISMLGALAVTLTLKLIFDNRFWWAGTLVMAALPAWFLHSRTAFETVMMVSFYACFICAYLLYRYLSPRYLAPALIFGAATFYSYTNGQGVMLVSGVLLFCSDLRYHLRQSRRTWLVGLILALVLAAPYIRFRWLYPESLISLHPDALAYELGTLDSYWVKNIPLGEKLAIFGQTYLQGLSPGYWFFPNQVDLDRHQMKGMGHLSVLALPFLLIGLVVCLRQWRSSAHRAVLIALLAAPFSAAVVGILIMRVLAMVVPATLLICIGLNQIADWGRRRVPAGVLAIGSGAILMLISFGVLRAALVDGPTWYTDYGLYGMQYGAAQVFSSIHTALEKSPDTRIVLSPNWANNTGVFSEFFLPEAERNRVEMRTIDSLLVRKRDINPNQLFILPPDEYTRAQASDKLVVQPPEQIIPYPDGKPGFYFTHIRYADNADAIFAAERVARQQLDQATVDVDGQSVQVRYSKLDQGRLVDLFDNDVGTLIRGLEANPLVLEFTFPKPRTIRGLKLQTATMDFSLKVEISPPDGGAPHGATSTYRGLPSDPRIDYALPGGPTQAGKVRIEITDLNPGEEVHIHVRELAFY